MAIASLILPFLPLLPVQILLNNFLNEQPAIAIASDKVDEELTVSPKKWNMHTIRRFMIIFGLQSSIFDFATFGLLYYVFHASPEEFRTAWFMESLLTEILILLIIRTQRPFFRSKPSGFLLGAALVTLIACITIPYLPWAARFELYPLPLNLYGWIALIVFVYVVMAELSKKYLLKKI
jgi:Mg2+-importing ATPase